MPDYNMPTLIVAQGWQCPVCHGVMAPHSPACIYCKPKPAATFITGMSVVSGPNIAESK